MFPSVKIRYRYKEQIGALQVHWNISVETSLWNIFQTMELTTAPTYAGWTGLSIPKLRLLHRWCLGIDRWCDPTLLNRCNYLSVEGLKLIHGSKGVPWDSSITESRFHVEPSLTWIIWRIDIHVIIISIKYDNTYRKTMKLMIVMHKPKMDRPMPT